MGLPLSLFTRSLLKLPPPRRAFPWSSFPYWLLGAEPREASGRAGRVLQTRGVFPSNSEGRDGMGNY